MKGERGGFSVFLRGGEGRGEGRDEGRKGLSLRFEV